MHTTEMTGTMKISPANIGKSPIHDRNIDWPRKWQNLRKRTPNTRQNPPKRTPPGTPSIKSKPEPEPAELASEEQHQMPRKQLAEYNFSKKKKRVFRNTYIDLRTLPLRTRPTGDRDAGRALARR